jgi:hypothetical protein
MANADEEVATVQRTPVGPNWLGGKIPRHQQCGRQRARVGSDLEMPTEPLFTTGSGVEAA